MFLTPDGHASERSLLDAVIASDGGRVYEQPITLSFEGRVQTFRRVSVVLDEPTRDGDPEIHILTNLPQKQTALVVARLYRRRFGIETTF